MANVFAASSRLRAAQKDNAHGPGKRRKLDDYETPEGVTLALINTIDFTKADKVLEPAAGSGRMATVLKRIGGGMPVVTSDIKRGNDFLARQAIFAGHIITNPPYKDGLAEKFCRKALHLADGKVAMLVQSGFVYGGDRAEGLFAEYVPAHFIHIPERIYFINAGTGKPIKSQFYNHLWVVWDERGKRARVKNGDTRTWIVSSRPYDPTEGEFD